MHPTVSSAVHHRERTYFSVVSTVRYASVFQPLGQRKTSLRTSASAEERLHASTCTMGIRQSSIRIRQNRAISKSPIWVFLDLIMPSFKCLEDRAACFVLISSTSLPDAALAKFLGQPVGEQQEDHAHHALEQAHGGAQRELAALDTALIHEDGDGLAGPLHQGIA